MFEGRLEAIYVAREATAPPSALDTVEAVAGRGLAGDRYAAGVGTWSRSPGPQRQVTLIESEAVAALARDHDLAVDAGETRRNLVTAGVPLNHLVGATFRVGDAVLRGVELCEPCGHLDKVAGRRLSRHLVHRGGLNAEVVAGAILRVGDRIVPAA
jgi:MOSC domain-containing protein YiiM